MRFVVKSKRFTLIAGGVLLLVAGLTGWFVMSQRPQVPEYENKPLASISDVPTKGGPRLTKPDFALYYPKKVPQQFFVDRGSIKYAKDEFAFNIRRDNQVLYYVSEQPVAGNFRFDDFKRKLSSAVDIETKLGSGAVGSLNNSLITGVKTKDNTLIIINCVDTACLASSRQILDSMQPVASFDDL